MFLIPQFTLPINNVSAAKGSLFFSLPMLINGLEQSPGETSRCRLQKGGRLSAPTPLLACGTWPERGCPQPQQHRPRNVARVFRASPRCGRAAAGDSRAPVAMLRRSTALLRQRCDRLGLSQNAAIALLSSCDRFNPARRPILVGQPDAIDPRLPFQKP
jgi:hypothetical protein